MKKPGVWPVRSGPLRPLIGLAAVVVLAAVVALAASLFRGALTESASITVLSPRAGLVMNPDAKVKMHGVPIGKVSTMEYLPDGRAALHLDLDPTQMALIPDNVRVDIAASTVFGAKFVQLVSPAVPSPQSLQAGQVLTADRVTVEISTVFEQLTSVLAQIQPAKLNATLSALSSALSGRGEKLGQTITDLNSALAQLNPSLPRLSHDIERAPQVLGTLADVTPDLLTTTANATRLSQTIVDKEQELDALLLSATGLGDIGIDVIGGNRDAITELLRVLVPTTDLTAEYQRSIYCSVAGLWELQNGPPLRNPGVEVLAGFLWGTDRYRYPADLPKVAAAGGPQCTDMPKVPFGKKPPQVITDIGINPWRYNNPGIVLNSDGLKQLLFGPIDGPPRNTAQIGQPG